MKDFYISGYVQKTEVHNMDERSYCERCKYRCNPVVFCKASVFNVFIPLHVHFSGVLRMARRSFFTSGSLYLYCVCSFLFNLTWCLWFDLHTHLSLLVLFLRGCVTIRRWKYKRVPVTIVSKPHPTPRLTLISCFTLTHCCNSSRFTRPDDLHWSPVSLIHS